MRLWMILGVVLFSTTSFAPAPKQSGSKEELQQKYVNFLSERDYFSKIDSDGDVQFKHDGKTLYIEVNENDLQFFRVVCPNIWSIESETERIQILKAADVVNRKSKVLKIYTNHKDVWVSLETFCKSPDDYESYFDRSLSVMMSGIKTFVDEMQ